jgi:hypothetical protein
LAAQSQHLRHLLLQRKIGETVNRRTAQSIKVVRRWAHGDPLATSADRSALVGRVCGCHEVTHGKAPRPLDIIIVNNVTSAPSIGGSKRRHGPARACPLLLD